MKLGILHVSVLFIDTKQINNFPEKAKYCGKKLYVFSTDYPDTLHEHFHVRVYVDGDLSEP